MTPILSRALVLRFVSMVGASISFFLPLAVIPMYAGSTSAAGWANGALLIATVLGELVTPRLVVRIGYRWALAIGLVLLGAPALVLLVTPALPVVLAVGIVRGLGFAITIVAGGALTAMLIPAERRGEGLGIVGLVNGIPSLLALPLGVWAAGHWGFGVVFVVTALAPLAAVVTVPGLPDRDASGGATHGVLGGLRNSALTRPATVFAAAAAAVGVVVTYLPLAVGGHVGGWVAPVALLVQPGVATASRWVAGRLGDRRGQAGLLVPSVVLCGTGMALIAATGSALLVVTGAALLGAGFGVLQNATLSMMYARVPAAGFGAVSAIWNAAYDLGMAAGSIGVGMLVATTGFPLAFLCTAALLVPALVLAVREAGYSLRMARRISSSRSTPAFSRAAN
jgi:MFS family permease